MNDPLQKKSSNQPPIITGGQPVYTLGQKFSECTLIILAMLHEC